jgi:hypothetical protein
VEAWIQGQTSCQGIRKADPSSIDGDYVIMVDSGSGPTPTATTCDMPGD